MTFFLLFLKINSKWKRSKCNSRHSRSVLPFLEPQNVHGCWGWVLGGSSASPSESSFTVSSPLFSKTAAIICLSLSSLLVSQSSCHIEWYTDECINFNDRDIRLYTFVDLSCVLFFYCPSSIWSLSVIISGQSLRQDFSSVVKFQFVAWISNHMDSIFDVNDFHRIKYFPTFFGLF